MEGRRQIFRISARAYDANFGEKFKADQRALRARLGDQRVRGSRLIRFEPIETGSFVGDLDGIETHKMER